MFVERDPKPCLSRTPGLPLSNRVLLCCVVGNQGVAPLGAGISPHTRRELALWVVSTVEADPASALPGFSGDDSRDLYDALIWDPGLHRPRSFSGS